MSSHLKPLYMGAHLDGVPVSKILIDTGATVNILPASIKRKLKKYSDELISTETMVSGFVGDTTTSRGIIPLQVRVGQKIGSMEACVCPQFLQFWHEDGSVETVQADARPFMVPANAMEADFYDDDIGPLYFTGPNRNGQPTGVSA
ncbi:unnamed protein product [Prunus armeniaca]